MAVLSPEQNRLVVLRGFPLSEACLDTLDTVASGTDGSLIKLLTSDLAQFARAGGPNQEHYLKIKMDRDGGIPKKESKIYPSSKAYRDPLKKENVQFAAPSDPPPSNIDDIRALLQPQSPLQHQSSPSQQSPPLVTEADHDLFKRRVSDAANKKDVEKQVLKFLGDIDAFQHSSERVGNWKSISELIALSTPSHFDGLTKTTKNYAIRQEMREYIDPCSGDKVPYLPTFFLEWDGPSGTVLKAENQITGLSAHGARGVFKLRQKLSEEQASADENAYVFSAFFMTNFGLSLFCTYRQKGEDDRYIMYELDSWNTKKLEQYRQAVAALRNIRTYAAELRENLEKEVLDHLAYSPDKQSKGEEDNESDEQLDGESNDKFIEQQGEEDEGDEEMERAEEDDASDEQLGEKDDEDQMEYEEEDVQSNTEGSDDWGDNNVDDGDDDDGDGDDGDDSKSVMDKSKGSSNEPNKRGGKRTSDALDTHEQGLASKRLKGNDTKHEEVKKG